MRLTSARRASNGELNTERVACAGSYPQLFIDLGDVAGGEPSLVCGRGRRLPRLLLGKYDRVLQGRAINGNE